MMFISYAQNCEDVLLWRALQDVTQGFYIDVGANDPVADSVTCAFYERGWQGINIEPVKSHFDDLCAQRPRDINLQVAASEQAGVLDLWEFETRGWATACEASMLRLQAQGHQSVYYQVEASRLADVCRAYVQGPIHFLKIDVEGFEASVLAGMDFEHYRPWILLVEVEPAAGSQLLSPSWEMSLLACGYVLVFNDGLNRYYLAQEQAVRATHFRVPPGVLDKFQRYEVVQLQAKAEGLHADLLAVRSQYDALYQRYDALYQRYEEVHQQYINATETEQQLRSAWGDVNHQRYLAEQTCHALSQQVATYEASVSWRITAPLRRLNAWLRRLLQGKRSISTESISVDAAQEQFAMAMDEVPASDIFNRAALPLQPRCLGVTTFAAESACWVRMVGHIEGHYSLSIVNRYLAQALNVLNNERLLFVPYHGGPYTELPVLSESDQAIFYPILQRDSLCVDTEDVVSLVHHYPFMHDPEAAGCKTTLFFWEESALPAATLAHLNQFDVVFVASTFVADVLVNAGCTAEIIQIPLGVDHLPLNREMEDVSADSSGFRFLHVSSAFERKGVDCLLRAYFDRFSASDPVELVIKTFPNPHNHVEQWLAELRQRYPAAPRVVVDEASISADEMVALIASANVMVLPSRGEGFNLPAAEAMALGVPVITTGYSGHLDFCTLTTAELVALSFAPSRSHLHAQGSYWAEPDVTALGRSMLQMYQRLRDGDAQVLEKVRAAQQFIREQYTWARAAGQLLSGIASFRSRAGKANGNPVRVDVISPYATRCGIAEYTRSLLGDMLQQSSFDVRLWCDSRTDSDQVSVQPSWTVGVDASVTVLLDRLMLDLPDVLLVQHQPSVFGLSDEVCQRLSALSKAGCVVVLELHSTRPLLQDFSLSGLAISSLRQLDRVIVHQIDDLNCLLELGLMQNVMLFGLGCIEPLPASVVRTCKADLAIPEQALVLGCFGFALLHKGLDCLIEAVLPLELELQRPVYLLMVNAVRDNNAAELVTGYQQRTDTLGIADRVIWKTDFLPIETAQSLLNAADYMVFPYKKTKESASAAVTLGLAVERPVLVSPLNIFTDLEGVVYRMQGCDAEAIVAAIAALERDADKKAEVLSAQTEWLNQRGWSSVSRRFTRVISALLRGRYMNGTEAKSVDSYILPVQKQLFVDVTVIHGFDGKTGIQRTIRHVLTGLSGLDSSLLSVYPVRYDNGEYVYCAAFAQSGGKAAYSDGEKLQFNPGDCFLGLDLTAHLFPEILPYLQHMRRSGVSLYYYVYDILPLTWPDLFDEGLRAAFRQWIVDIADVADGLICISKFTANEVAAYMRSRNQSLADEKLHVVHIGADFTSSSSDLPPIQALPDTFASLNRLLGVHSSMLMVGTVEPRKGHEQVLSAFEQLWAQGEGCVLVIVGKSGWMYDDLIERLRQHPELGRHLFWFEGLADETLAHLYQHCDCLMAASYVEGFGLPLIEAAQTGLPLLVRDIPVFREVAGEYATYFKAGDSSELAEVLTNWWPVLKAGSAIKSQALPFLTWQQSVDRLCEVLGITHTIPEDVVD